MDAKAIFGVNESNCIAGLPFQPAYNNNNEAFFCGFHFNSKHCNTENQKIEVRWGKLTNEGEEKWTI